MALAFAAAAGTAQATAFTAQYLLSNFNLISSGNVATQQDIEGSTVVGGNLNGATFFNNGSSLPAKPAIYIYGSLGGNNVNINNSGTLYYSGTATGVNFNGGSTQNKILPNVPTDYTAPLTQLSSQLGALTATAGTTFTNGNFNANGATGLVVFNLTASQLAANLVNASVTFTGAAATSFIVNVSGSFAEGSSTNFNNTYANVIFNFTDATSVSLGNWKASVLAPNASLNISNGFVDGSVFAASFAGGGELHNDNRYAGALPASAPVPEASTWAMMLAGFALIGMAIRTRREPELVSRPVRI